MSLTYVFLAGIGNSDAEHWQRRWAQRTPRSVWVEHVSWEEPERDGWVADLDRSLRQIAGPKLLIAHSLGCLLVCEWAAEHRDPEIVGACLVAVPDPHGPAFPTQAGGFGRSAPTLLPFRSLLIASADDAYATIDYAASVAAKIGAVALVEVGNRGHLNAASGLGDWPDGLALVRTHFPQANDLAAPSGTRE